MIAAFAKGDVDRARRSTPAARVLRLRDREMRPVPRAAKAMLRVLGLPAGHAGLPMGPEPDGLEAEAPAMLGAWALLSGLSHQ